MKNVIVETFLSEYFLAEVVFGDFINDKKRLFNLLAQCFYLDGKVDGLFEKTQESDVKQLVSDKEFFRYQRCKQYLSQIGNGEANADDEVMQIKGNVICTAKNFKLLHDQGATQTMVHKLVSSAESFGVIHAIRLVGVLNYFELIEGADKQVGEKNLQKASDWNDLVACLVTARFDENNREYAVARLKTVTDGTLYAVLAKQAEKFFGIECDKVAETELLEKAFSSGIVNRDCYRPSYARVIFGKRLGLKDKQRLVFANNRALVAQAGDLPLKLSDEKIGTFDEKIFDSVAVKRSEENQAIKQKMANSDLRSLETFRPVCIASDCNYLLNMYADAMRQVPHVHFERLDVSDLSEYDCAPNVDNVFSRSCNEDKDNVYLLFFKGRIDPKVMDCAKLFLQSAKRKKFHLAQPGVTIDLSQILPVCFADMQNAEALKGCCDVIKLASTTKEEMANVFSDVLSKKSKLYGATKMKIDFEPCKTFDGIAVDDVEKIVDEAVKTLRKDSHPVMSDDVVIPLIEKYRTPAKRILGFGGASNDNK